MLDTYRAVLGLPGAFRFSSAALIARLPISMVSLGIVLLVQARSGSYATAGLVSGVFVISEAATAIVHGRLLDRFGQSRVLRGAVLLFSLTLTALIVFVELGWPLGWVLLAAVLSGGTLPQVGSSVRTRWSHTTTTARELQTAFALESVLDEVVFIVGPVLVTLLATLVDPVAGLVTALGVGLVGTMAFTALRDTEPAIEPRHNAAGERPAMPWHVLTPLLGIAVSLGALFGAAEVTTVAFAQTHATKAWAGPLLAGWSFGSLLAGVVTGAIHWRLSTVTRLRWGALGMALAMLPLPFITDTVLMGAVMFVGGFAIAPTLIAALSLVEESVPSSRLTEGMGIVHTGLMVGVAPGASLAGIVVDGYSASSAYFVSVAAGLVGVAGALLIRQRAHHR